MAISEGSRLSRCILPIEFTSMLFFNMYIAPETDPITKVQDYFLQSEFSKFEIWRCVTIDNKNRFDTSLTKLRIQIHMIQKVGTGSATLLV